MEGEFPDADFALDEHGNPKGGVRSPYVDVPVRTFTWVDDFTVFSRITPFGPEKLKSLYLTRRDYFEKCVRSVMRMIGDGFLLPEDAADILFDVLKAEIPE